MSGKKDEKRRGREGNMHKFSQVPQKFPVTQAKKQKNYGQTAGFVVN